MTSRPAPHRPFDIPSLDGLRALSFLVVFASHTALCESSSVLRMLFPGSFGVTVFFFLSGYLITTLLRREAEQTGRVSLGGFYFRRTLRIFPPYYLYLLMTLALVLGGWLSGTFSVGALLAQAGFLANYWDVYVGQGQMPGTQTLWSLAVEEHFYLFFPLFFLMMGRCLRGRPATQAGVLLVFCGVVLLWRAALVLGFGVSPDPDDPHFYPRIYSCTDTRIDAILFGCVLAVWGNPALDASRLPDWCWRWLAGPLGLVLLLISFAYREPIFRETFRYTLQSVALMPIFAAAIRCARWGPYRLLNWKPLRAIGILSYSLYLVHYPLTLLVHQWLPDVYPFAQAVIAFALSLAVATGIYYAVERPIAALRRRWGSNRPRQAPVAAPRRVLEPAAG